MGLKNNSRFLRLPPLGSLILMGVGVIFFIYLIYYYTNRSNDEVPIVPYSEFLEKVENDKVARVKIGNRLILYQLKSLSLLSPSQDLLPLPESPLDESNNSSNPLHGSTASTPSQRQPSSNGGKVLGSISKKLDYLIVGNSKPTKRKIDQAKELKVKIITEAEWNKILNS